MNEKLLFVFRAFRGQMATSAGKAIGYAREWLAKHPGETQYRVWMDWRVANRHATSVGGSPTEDTRWVQNPESLGWRMVGFADEINPRGIQHRGWYADANQDETYRGVVYLLPGKRGLTRLMVGYVDSENPDSAVLQNHIEATLRVDAWYGHGTLNHLDELCSAAYAADHLAETAAERARDYDTAWQAGARYASNRDEIKALRKQARSFVFAARDNVKANPTICEALTERVQQCREQVHDLIDECRELARGDASGLCFWPGDKELANAFNEGASADVI